MPIFSMRMVGVADGLNTTTATGSLDASMWSSSVLEAFVETVNDSADKDGLF